MMPKTCRNQTFRDTLISAERWLSGLAIFYIRFCINLEIIFLTDVLAFDFPATFF